MPPTLADLAQPGDSHATHRSRPDRHRFERRLPAVARPVGRRRRRREPAPFPSRRIRLGAERDTLARLQRRAHQGASRVASHGPHRGRLQGAGRRRCRRFPVRPALRRERCVADAGQLRHGVVLRHRHRQREPRARSGSRSDRPVHGERRRLLRHRRPPKPRRHLVQPAAARAQHAALVFPGAHRRRVAAGARGRTGRAAGARSAPSRHDAARRRHDRPVRRPVRRGAAGDRADAVRRGPHRARGLRGAALPAASAALLARRHGAVAARSHARRHVRGPPGRSRRAHVPARRCRRSRVPGLCAVDAACRVRAGAAGPRNRRHRNRHRGHDLARVRYRRPHRLGRRRDRHHLRRHRRVGRPARRQGPGRRRLDLAPLLQHQPDRRSLPGEVHPGGEPAAEAARLLCSRRHAAVACRAPSTR